MKFSPNAQVIPHTLMVGVQPLEIDVAGACGFSFSLAGWIATLGRAPTFVRLDAGGVTLGMQRVSNVWPDVNAFLASLAPPAPHAAYSAVGFQLSFSRLGLPEFGTGELICEFEDGAEPQRLLLGTISDLPPLPALSSHSGFIPIMIPALGRSGTTLMAGLLGAHPEILVAGVYPFEYRLASYFWHACYVTSAPAHHGLSMHPDGFETSHPNRIGFNPYNTRNFDVTLVHPGMRDWINTDRVIENIQHARAGVDSFYHRLAGGLGKSNAYHFVEKTLFSHLVNVAWHIHPRAREIFLVRDFRDNFASARAFNKARDSASFGRQSFASDAEWLVGRKHEVAAVAEAFRQRRDRCLLVRYEDLILNPQAELRRIFGYIGVADDAAVVKASLVSIAENRTGGADHRTSSSAQNSIGRWRQDLTPQEREVSTDMFRSSLELFGYSLS